MYMTLCPPNLLFQVSPHLSFQRHQRNQQNNGQQKLRIGFISCKFGKDEPHGLLLEEVIRNLPRNKFEVIGFGIGVKQPKSEFVSLFSTFHQTYHNHKTLAYLLSTETLDCLVFGEVQNEATVHFLAFRRFAYVQIAAMGSPVTSGNPSIDYFLSGESLEHPYRNTMSGDQLHEEHYSEQLIMFRGQAISYPKTQLQSLSNLLAPQSNAIQDTLPSNANVYMCFQSIQILLLHQGMP